MGTSWQCASLYVTILLPRDGRSHKHSRANPSRTQTLPLGGYVILKTTCEGGRVRVRGIPKTFCPLVCEIMAILEKLSGGHPAIISVRSFLQLNTILENVPGRILRPEKTWGVLMCGSCPKCFFGFREQSAASGANFYCLVCTFRVLRFDRLEWVLSDSSFAMREEARTGRRKGEPVK